MKEVGFIGWRGMVGSVLMSRMTTEKDWEDISPHFFTTSQEGELGPDLGKGSVPLLNANNINELKKMDILISCQGGDYTKLIYKNLREAGFKGFFIDAASTLRLEKDSTLILDPINKEIIKKALFEGKKDFIGANCTVSLMLMAVGGLFNQGLVEWMTTMTYQAASGGGAANMRELLSQMKDLGETVALELANPAVAILEIDSKISARLNDNNHPTKYFGAPLAGSLIPWIDSPVEHGQTREELKGFLETNKILGSINPIPVDGTCVRMGAMRCHSQGLTIKLNKDVPLNEIESILKESTEWTEVIPNNKEDTLLKLSPAYAAGKLMTPVGRLRKMNLGPKYLNAFTVGDQLLWGAAEPLRRMLRILLEEL